PDHRDDQQRHRSRRLGRLGQVRHDRDDPARRGDARHGRAPAAGRSGALSERRPIGAALLGYSFMGDAYSRALLSLRTLEVPFRPELVSISGRSAEPLERARERYGWGEAVTDWREQVEDERVGLFVNGGPNSVHAEPTIAAAQ